MDGLSQFPKVSPENLPIWDAKRNACCGYLSKKAGQSSTFRKGTWQSRFFQINIDLSGRENYSLSYSHSANDTTVRQTYALEFATLETLHGNEFQLTMKDGTKLSLDAATYELTNLWTDTLKHVIEIATTRSVLMHERMKTVQKSENASGLHKVVSSPTAKPNPITTPKKPAPLLPEMRTAGDDEEGEEEPPVAHAQGPYTNPFAVRHRSVPTLRFDMDISTMPPRSDERQQFEEMFVNDLGKILKVPHEYIEIHTIKAVVGMEWLTDVEFDIYILHKETHVLVAEINEHGDKTEEEIEEILEELENERTELRQRLLWTLNEMVQNTNSALFHGFVTCKIDPTYPLNLGDKEDDRVNPTVLFSTDPDIFDILKKYDHVMLPSNDIDMSHFPIQLCFEGQRRTLNVPNPMVLRKGACAVWPFEIKQALGLMGTAQELWVEPTALVPRGLPKNLSQSIPFLPSARFGGGVIINAGHLKANLAYDVVCDDYRAEVMKSLSEEDLEKMHQTFEEYDIDGDGEVSRKELEEMIRHRTHERRSVIDAKFQEFLDDESTTIGVTEDGQPIKDEQLLTKAEDGRRLGYQQLAEAQVKLIRMFEAADLDGNGKLTFYEFMLAEAWWMKCTLNPNQVHMF